uniref:Uncharacterized protein n=1 Tax=Amphimedon queenslandica TaxID=400682 RepID=A0A1X7U9M4_AMPQE
MCSSESVASNVSEFESTSLIGAVYCFQGGFGLYPLLDLQETTYSPSPRLTRSQSFDLSLAANEVESDGHDKRQECWSLVSHDGKQLQNSVKKSGDHRPRPASEDELWYRARPRAFAFCNDQMKYDRRRQLESLNLHISGLHVDTDRTRFHFKLINCIKMFFSF